MEIGTVKAEQKLSIQTLGKRKIVKEGFASDWMEECEQVSELQKVFEDGKAAYRMVFQHLQDEVAQ